MIDEYKKLIDDFSKLPINKDKELTLLEICRYPRSRFEEVCSRILKFFLDPEAEHNLGRLWIQSILEMVGKNELNNYRSKVIVKTEEMTEAGNRIDIMVVADRFVIVIENKITAALYNPMNDYENHIKKNYGDKDAILIVLSLYKCIIPSGCHFRNYTYGELFQLLSGNMDFIVNADSRYLIFMFDFIKTLQNMTDSCNMLERNFFYENSKIIEKLISKYQNFQNDCLSEQYSHIVEIQKILKSDGSDWWIWGNNDLGVTFSPNGKRDDSEIGIESWYIPNKETKNPCGLFQIMITRWQTEDWGIYNEEILEKTFPGSTTQVEHNRIYLYLPLIDSSNDDNVISALKDTYNKLKRIVENR